MILRLLEKEASSIAKEKVLTGLYSWLFYVAILLLSLLILLQMIIESSVCICLKKKLYARSQKDKIITADVS